MSLVVSACTLMNVCFVTLIPVDNFFACTAFAQVAISEHMKDYPGYSVRRFACVPNNQTQKVSK